MSYFCTYVGWTPNTVYMAAVIEQLRQDGYAVQESDLAYLSPCRYEHINPYGKYDFEVKWSEDVSLFTALPDQLGLKLDAQRAAVDVVVVDSIERPAED